MMDIWTNRLIEGLAVAGDENSARAILAKLTYEAGFSVYSYLTVQGDRASAISNYPAQWQRQYVENCYMDLDPVIIEARARMEAFSWSRETSRRMAKASRHLMGEAAFFGIRSGITVPVSIGYGRLALLSMASPDADRGSQHPLNPVLAAAAVGQLHIRMSMIAAGGSALRRLRIRPEELACLRWSAEGKSMRAIAEIEKTSYANVVFFLRNAKTALGATTLPQATALAKEYGLI